MPLTLKFTICHPHEIEQTAFQLSNKILSHRDGLSDVVDHILAAATSHLAYTRSLALLVAKMVEILGERNTELSVAFQEEVADVVVATYVDYWSNMLCCGFGRTSTRIEFVDSYAISAFIGDLSSFEILNFAWFEVSMAFLMNRMKTRHHLQCLRLLFAHAGAYHDPCMTPSFINDCLIIIKWRCIRYLGMFTVEEQSLRALLYNIIHRDPTTVCGHVYEPRLNIEEALMASVRYPETIKLSSAFSRPSSGSSGYSSRSGSLSGSPALSTSSSVDSLEPKIDETLVEHGPKLHHPQPIRLIRLLIPEL